MIQTYYLPPHCVTVIGSQFVQVQSLILGGKEKERERERKKKKKERETQRNNYDADSF